MILGWQGLVGRPRPPAEASFLFAATAGKFDGGIIPARPLGAPHPTRRIIVGLINVTDSSPDLEGLTIGDVEATIIDSHGAGRPKIFVCMAHVPEGETASIASHWPDNASMAAIGIRVINLRSTTPGDVATDDETSGSLDASVSVSAPGLALAFGATRRNRANTGETSWTGLTKRGEVMAEGSNEGVLRDGHTLAVAFEHRLSAGSTAVSMAPGSPIARQTLWMGAWR